MPLFTSLSALSQTPASNPPDGSVDAPSTIDDQLRLLGSFIAQLRDGVGFSTSAFVPAGAIVDYAGATAPTGFLMCDGSPVSRTTYATLFAAIGTWWGAGDGSTTFNLPNLIRRVTVGAGGTATSTLGNSLGSLGGEEAHALTTAELAAHNHGVNDSGHVHGNSLNDSGHAHNWGDNSQNGAGIGSGNLGGGATGHSAPTSISGTGITINNAAASTGISIQNAGSGSAHNNIQPSAVVNKIIKF